MKIRQLKHELLAEHTLNPTVRPTEFRYIYPPLQINMKCLFKQL